MANKRNKTYSLKIALQDKSTYKIFLGQNILHTIIFDSKYSKYFVISDEKVAGLHASTLIKQLQRQAINAKLIKVPQGERAKSIRVYNDVITQLIENKADRKSFLIALGGGVIGDLAGFVAATFMRGIDYISIPTTLLSMADSCVGGKTGINHELGKNLVGTFNHPKSVYIDTRFLDTLPQNELRFGLIEIVKHALIKDKKLFQYIEKNLEQIFKREQKVLIDIIYKSLKIKKELIEIDEKENNQRKLLNYGHTLGHAIESASDYLIPHGQAVGTGIILAGNLAVKLKFLSEADNDRQHNLIKRIVQPVQNVESSKLLANLCYDKKRNGEKIGFVLLNEIGNAFFLPETPKNSIINILGRGH